MNPKTDKTPKAPSVKQQIVDKIKAASNVLVTVSADPSVDQLSALLGLTLVLNKLDKHATAVFSGRIPSTLEFLQPEKTLEMTTDSLRDFIISLDKSKADKLRYKVEDDTVKIFITPYRTSITGDDLVFTQGDFNVDVIIALGVNDSEHLDRAVLENGRILHDAAIITLACGDDAVVSELGTLNWYEPTASSLSEMVVSMIESFGSGLLDGQMSTAFLTGIVARTDRFSNEKTTPKTMTMSAQLMAAGANQQLIATQLAVVEQIVEEAPEPALESEQESQPGPEFEPVTPYASEDPIPQDEPTAEIADIYQPPEPSGELELPEPVSETGNTGLDFNLHGSQDESTVGPAEIEEETVEEVPELAVAPEPYSQIDHTPPIAEMEESGDLALEQIKIDEHGTLRTKAEEEEAAHAKLEAQQAKQRVIQPLNAEPPVEKTNLSNYIFEQPAQDAPFTAAALPDLEEQQAPLDPMGVSSERRTDMMIHNKPTQPAEPPSPPAPEPDFPIEAPLQSLADLEQAIGSPHATQHAYAESARDSVSAAINDPHVAPLRPDPRHDLNSSPLSNVLNRPPEPPAEQQAPPAVPPPLPQFMQAPK